MIIGFTAGAWDLLHPGHIACLGACKSSCDQLYVGLQTNPAIDRTWKHVPVQTSLERYVQLTGCKYVDRIIPYDTEKDLENIFGLFTINKYFIGGDHIKDTPTGKDICNKVGVEIKHIDRVHNYSTSSLRKRIELL